MGWEQRLREMVLAGGALAATACSGSTAVPETLGAGGNSPSGGLGGDATAGEFGGDATGGDASPGSSSVGCCNADPDPCCTCTGEITDADPESACGHELACQAAGGTWDPYYNSYNGVVTPPHCEFEASDEDAALDGAGPDAATNAAADASACGTCGVRDDTHVCVENLTLGGVRIPPDDAGGCPGDRVILPEEPNNCSLPPVFSCEGLPAACFPAGAVRPANCVCAPSLCTNGACADVSPTLVTCTLAVP